jgi:Glycosyltransferase family 17
VNDELDALETRMGEMDQVNYFVIVESETTFSNKQKPLYL